MFRERIRECYIKLYNSNLVRGSIQDKDVEYFEKWLNLAMPKDEAEVEHMKTIKDICLYSPNSQNIIAEWQFNRIKSKTSMFVLHTNAKIIHEHFKLHNRVKIYWDKSHRIYHVNTHNEKIKSNNYPKLQKNYDSIMKKTDTTPEIFKKIKPDTDTDTNAKRSVSEVSTSLSEFLESVKSTGSWAD